MTIKEYPSFYADRFLGKECTCYNCGCVIVISDEGDLFNFKIHNRELKWVSADYNCPHCKTKNNVTHNL